MREKPLWQRAIAKAVLLLNLPFVLLRDLIFGRPK